MAWPREACISGAGDDMEITAGFEFDGAGCEGMVLWLHNAARMPGKLSVKAFDIAWANASLLVLMFCPAGKTDDPAEDTTPAPVDGTTSLTPSNMVVARLLFVVRGIKSTQKPWQTPLCRGRKMRNLTTKTRGRKKQTTKAKENRQDNSKHSYCFDTPRWNTLQCWGALSLPCPQQTADRLTNTRFSL